MKSRWSKSGASIVSSAGREWQRNWLRTGGRANRGEFGDQSSPLFRNETMARVEAILFVAREPLTSRKIAQLGSLSDGTQARTVIRQLNKLYDTAGCAFRVEEIAGGYQLFTRPMFGPWLRRLLQTTLEIRLSSPAMETLAVVAYRQPILRAEVEAIRGVQCGDLLRQLLDRDLIRISGRADDLGRPLVYGTTKQFLQVFGLRHLDELPRAAQLRRTKTENEASSDKLIASQQAEMKKSAESKSTTTVKETSSDDTSNHLRNIPDINHVRFHEEELC
jgi:segregation and condensation protein B